MKERLRWASHRLLYGNWPWKGAFVRRRPRVIVLAYHRIASAPHDRYAVSPSNFEAHLRALAESCEVVSVAEFVDRFEAGRLADRTAVVTFDDGYVDTLSNAYPIAAKLATPIALFVTVSPVLEGGPFWWDEIGALIRAAPGPVLHLRLPGGDEVFPIDTTADRSAAYERLHPLFKRMRPAEREGVLDQMRRWREPGTDDEAGLGRPMNVSELRRLAGLPGVTIGAHTLSHRSLASLPAREQATELEESRTVIESLVGGDVPWVSYPFGQRHDLGPTTADAARAAGYRAGFTAIPSCVRSSDHPFAIPRIIIHDWPEEVFRQRLGRFVGALESR